MFDFSFLSQRVFENCELCHKNILNWSGREEICNAIYFPSCSSNIHTLTHTNSERETHTHTQRERHTLTQPHIFSLWKRRDSETKLARKIFFLETFTTHTQSRVRSPNVSLTFFLVLVLPIFTLFQFPPSRLLPFCPSAFQSLDRDEWLCLSPQSTPKLFTCLSFHLCVYIFLSV